MEYRCFVRARYGSINLNIFFLSLAVIKVINLVVVEEVRTYHLLTFVVHQRERGGDGGSLILLTTVKTIFLKQINLQKAVFGFLIFEQACLVN